MKSLSTDALYLISDYMHAGWPKDEIDIQRFRRADCSDWSLWAGREDCTGSVRDAIKADEKIRELIDWDDLKDSSCMTEDELIDEIAFQCWNWYWGCKVDSGEMDDIENDLKKEEQTMNTTYFTDGDVIASIRELDDGKVVLTIDGESKTYKTFRAAKAAASQKTSNAWMPADIIVYGADTRSVIYFGSDILKAMEARDASDEEAVMIDGHGRELDPDYEWELFVSETFSHSGNVDENQPYETVEEADETIRQWIADGVEVPYGLTGRVLAQLWLEECRDYRSEWTQEDVEMECRQSNDAASYQETVREAASFEAIDVDDLDDILREDQPDDDFTVDPDEYFPPQEDPLMKQLQLALDAAVADRDETGNRWRALTEEPGATELECHRAYTRYEHSQGYLEGLTNGIFAAGYNIRTDVDTTKMTVTK